MLDQKFDMWQKLNLDSFLFDLQPPHLKITGRQGMLTPPLHPVTFCHLWTGNVYSFFRPHLLYMYVYGGLWPVHMEFFLF
jgi:hypothetical protein